MATTDQSASGSRTGSETDTPVDCPLCAWRADDRTGVYQHMMVSHRKSELSRTLLSVVEAADSRGDGTSGVDDADPRSDGVRS